MCKLNHGLLYGDWFGLLSMSDHPPKRSRQQREEEYLQLQAARDAEEAIRNLQRTQEQLLELEQERLLAEQRRLKEERFSREALREKAELQRATRARMAALELEVKTFGDDLSRKSLLESQVNGVAIASYRFALLQKKLAALSVYKPELDDLADIRFFGELEYSIERLSASHSEPLGPASVQAAVEQLRALAGWRDQLFSMGEDKIQPLGIQTKARAVADSLPETLEEVYCRHETLAAIREALNAARTSLSQTKLIVGAFERLWEKVKPVLHVLDSARVDRAEREFITEQNEPSLESQLQSILDLQRDISERLRILQEAEGVWVADDAHVQKAVLLLQQKDFSAAEEHLASVKNRLWKDIHPEHVAEALNDALVEVVQAIQLESGGNLALELRATESWLERHGGSRTLREGLELHRSGLLKRREARNASIKTWLKVVSGMFACALVGKAASVVIEKIEARLSQPENPTLTAQREETAAYFREKEESERLARIAGETAGASNAAPQTFQKETGSRKPVQKLDPKDGVEQGGAPATPAALSPTATQLAGLPAPPVANPADQQADKIAFDANFKRIASGFFQMGEAGDVDAPLHAVTVGEFFISVTEVTFQEWKDIKGWADSAGYSFEHEGAGKKPNHPVTDVSWYDVVKWCNARSERAGLRPCYYTSAARDPGSVYRQGAAAITPGMIDVTANGYRLPTEAEWEKAARGGVAGRRFPNGQTLSIREANFLKVGGGTLAVKYYIPNPYGLYEMAGNVMEWCQDWYRADAYKTSPPEDPLGPVSGEGRVVRGGSWSDPKPDNCRVSFRQPSAADSVSNNKGFRLVRRPAAR